MHYYLKYSFKVGRKAEFRDLFTLVDGFLSEQKLNYSFMGYDLACYDLDGSSSGCHKLNKKLPQMGQIQIVEKPHTNEFRISNLDLSGCFADTGCDEETVRFVASKIPRPYNFHYSAFLYCGIPFFGRTDTQMLRMEEGKPYLNCMDLLGNYVMLCRNFGGPKSTAVVMVMEITDQQEAEKANAYAQALSNALGGVKYSDDIFTIMTVEDKERYSVYHTNAEDAARRALNTVETMVEQMESEISEDRDIDARPRFSLSKPLKKLGKSFGYGDYAYDPIGAYSLAKEIEHGHKITLFVDMGPMCRIVHAIFYFSGVGFAYHFPIGGYTPNTQEEADLLIREVFSILQRIEDPYLTQIGANYPDSPTWMRDSLSSIYCKLRKNQV